MSEEQNNALPISPPATGSSLPTGSLAQAIAGLDDSEDAHWNSKGEPNMQYLKNLLGLSRMPSRAEADAASPRRRQVRNEADTETPCRIRLLTNLDTGDAQYQAGAVVELEPSLRDHLIEIGSAEQEARRGAAPTGNEH